MKMKKMEFDISFEYEAKPAANELIAIGTIEKLRDQCEKVILDVLVAANVEIDCEMEFKYSDSRFVRD